MSIRWNITLPILRELSKMTFINFKEENKCVDKYKDALRIKTPSINQLVGNLSGGNQQKVAVAKWLASESKILILDEPTRGIDVGQTGDLRTDQPSDGRRACNHHDLIRDGRDHGNVRQNAGHGRRTNCRRT